MIKLVIEGEPVSVNQTYKVGRGRNRGKMYLSPEARDYGEKIGWQARAQFSRLKIPILTQWLEVFYIYYFRHGNLDHLNYNKKLNDALENIVWANDKQIKVSHHYTKIDKLNPRVEIYIRQINEIKSPL